MNNAAPTTTTTTETLHDCPHCGRKNFTARGLKAHVCKGGADNLSASVSEPDRQIVGPTPEPLTLARLDAMPPVATHSVALKDLTVPQLGEAFRGLDAAQENYSKLSGICATMKGLVLAEVKAKVGHGNFGQWLKKHFPKSQRTAGKHIRLAAEFGKLEPTFQFADLTHDLASTLEAAMEHKLDLANPLVAKVAAWVGNRSAYQLELELEPTRKGGKTYDRVDGKGARHVPTPAEETAALQALCRNTAEHLSCVHNQRAFIALTEAELDGLLNHCDAVADALRNWKKLTLDQRKEQIAALALA